MKRFLVLLLAALTVSCSLDDSDYQELDILFLPITSVEVPQNVAPGHSYTFTIYYKREMDCYYVTDDFYYYAEGNVRTVAVQALVSNSSNCQPIEAAAPEMVTLQFQCPAHYTESNYIFRFYMGDDADGNHLYLEKDIPVQQ